MRRSVSGKPCTPCNFHRNRRSLPRSLRPKISFSGHELRRDGKSRRERMGRGGGVACHENGCHGSVARLTVRNGNPIPPEVYPKDIRVPLQNQAIRTGRILTAERLAL